MDNYFPIYLQYQNSPKLKSLVTKTANSLLFQNLNWSSDYLNIQTATSAGLDSWGIILGQTRYVIDPSIQPNIFGFDDGVTPIDNTTYPQNFYNSNFFDVYSTPSTTLTDQQYRALLLLLYGFNNCNNSLGTYNFLIQRYETMIGSRGVPYVINNGAMSIGYHFPYSLNVYEIWLFLHSNFLRAPCGVAVSVILS